MRRIAAVSCLLLLSVVITACGGGEMTSGTPTPTPMPISVSISPSSLPVPTGQTRTFVATVRNDSSGAGVTWELSGTRWTGAACGVLSSASATSVSYTAPSTEPVPPDLTLKATAVADASKSASAALTVFAAGTIAVSISPAAPSVETGASTELTATVANDPFNAGVTWDTQALEYCHLFPCGSLSPKTTLSGKPTTYSAPSTILSSLHSIIITARSVSDPEAIAQVEVKISCAKPKDCIP